jgi:agmatinase
MTLSSGVHDIFSVDIHDSSFDLGDVPLNFNDTDVMLEQIETAITNVVGWGKHPVILGGTNTITLGVLRALHKQYGKLAVVHFDARYDMDNNTPDANTWLYNAITEQLVDPIRVINIGVRGADNPKAREFSEQSGCTSFTARYADASMEAVVSQIKGLVGNMPCYLSFDMSCMDPAYAPGVSTQVIGGLSSMWISECLEQLVDVNFVGMDCVEVIPQYDTVNITSQAAATIIWTYISMMSYKEVIAAMEQNYNVPV